MKDNNKVPKEYAIVVSLAIFFFLIVLVGIIRLKLIIKDDGVSFNLTKEEILEQDTTMDLAITNMNLANYIRNKYALDVYYGNNLNLESVNAINVTDDNKIFNMLNKVLNALEKYPDNIITELEGNKYTVSLYLVDHFTNNIEALANRNTIGQLKIYMSDTTNIERAFHHEYYHIMDYYIRLENDDNTMYKEWKKINPIGFTYLENVNNITGKYVYNGEEGAYFVTAYAKYSEKEDRAETFAEMLTASKDEVFFKEGEKINAKMNIIRKTLEQNFKTVKYSYNLMW